VSPPSSHRKQSSKQQAKSEQPSKQQTTDAPDPLFLPFRKQKYDWRVAPYRLEERDGYFSELQLIIEEMVRNTGNKVVIIAHSLGNRVTHYFSRWAERKLGRQWWTENVDNWVALGPLWLGAPKLLRAMV